MEKFKYAGRRMKVTVPARSALNDRNLQNEIVLVEDYWINVSGVAWVIDLRNPACIDYAIRVANTHLPVDSNAVYAKTDDGLGYLFHVSELELIENEENL